ncbi:hypothetical protein K474DRAFT_1679580 [Panus rudis PR-1116 ss-1]|nr:hypothetical protein K474DRAFT_1679580 [Panus rudis PR-1116 ss-1]
MPIQREVTPQPAPHQSVKVETSRNISYNIPRREASSRPIPQSHSDVHTHSRRDQPPPAMYTDSSSRVKREHDSHEPQRQGQTPDRRKDSEPPRQPPAPPPPPPGGSDSEDSEDDRDKGHRGGGHHGRRLSSDSDSELDRETDVFDRYRTPRYDTVDDVQRELSILPLRKDQSFKQTCRAQIQFYCEQFLVSMPPLPSEVERAMKTIKFPLPEKYGGIDDCIRKIPNLK